MDTHLHLGSWHYRRVLGPGIMGKKWKGEDFLEILHVKSWSININLSDLVPGRRTNKSEEELFLKFENLNVENKVENTISRIKFKLPF